MRKFKVGDHVERIGALVPVYMRDGVVTRIIPNDDAPEMFTQYEVNFNERMIATFYGPQLRLVSDPD